VMFSNPVAVVDPAISLGSQFDGALK